jgi:hypothetical protein
MPTTTTTTTVTTIHPMADPLLRHLPAPTTCRRCYLRQAATAGFRARSSCRRRRS